MRIIRNQLSNTLVVVLARGGAWMLILILLGLYAGGAGAQAVGRAGAELPFRKLDMSHGLSFNSVMCLLEDSQGLLWVGTREGLNRYDGYQFETFKHSPYDSLSLSNNHINVIFESSGGEMWLGTASGLNRYHPATQGFTSYGAPPDSSGLTNSYVKTIIELADRTLWVGTSNGLTVLHPEEGIVEHRYLGGPHSHPNNVIALFRDRDDRVWLGTKGGLYIWESGWFRRVIVDPDTEKGGEVFEIRDIKQDERGVYWVATEQHGIYSFRYAGGVFRNEKHYHTGNSDILSNQVRKVFADDGKLWLATLSGLSILEIDSDDFTNIGYSIRRPDGISRGSIHDVIKDRFGGYWVATYSGGLNYFHPQHHLFEHYKRTAGVTDGLSENDVNGFLEDAAGNIWISTGRGLNYVNWATGVFRHYGADTPNGLSNRIIKSMVSDKQGNLWIGTYNGLNYYDAARGTFRHFLHQPGTNSINQNQVHALHIDEDGLLWIGMNMGELQVYDPVTDRFTDVPHVGSIVSYIYEDRNGRLWIGTRFGLKCVDRRTRQPIDISATIRGVEDELLFINWITEDSKGRLWIGTQSSGLFLLHDQQLHWFGQGNGLISNTINAVIEDNDGYLWISTNAGLSRAECWREPDSTLQFVAIDFFEIHGLQGAQFNPASALRTRSGRLYFGGINGFNAFYPAEVQKQTYFPDVRFSRLEINAKDAAVTHPGFGDIWGYQDSVITLAYNHRNISIDFSGINFVNPNATVYRYALSGLEYGWVDIGQQRSVNFTYLPIGEHDVRIQASSDPRVWGDSYASLKIIVLPPWWLTPIAYAVYVLLAGLLIYWVIRFFHRRAKRRNRIYVEQIMREKEQRMLASKLDFFTDVSHELRTPLTLILTPLERLMNQPDLSERVSEQLAMIRRNGQKMMEMINQVLHLRRFENEQHARLETERTDLVAFLKEIVLTFRPMATAKQVGFSFKFIPERLEADFDSSKLEIVLYNLLANAFKFTPQNGNVSLEMRHAERDRLQQETDSESHYITIAVCNTGKAIPADVQERIFHRHYSDNHAPGDNPEGVGIGLELSKRMMALHGGFLEVASDETGTCFTVGLPMRAQANEKRKSTVRNWDQEPREMGDGIIAKRPNPTGEKQTLLIVEDNEDVRALVRSVLEGDYRIEEAADGQQGWERALESIPDLVISDIMMPRVDGIELCRLLKTDIRTSHIPVVLLTARAAFAHKYEGYETGADAYITKPFSGNYLLVRIGNLIKQREAVSARLRRDAFLAPGTLTVNSVDDQLLKKAKEFVERRIADSSFTIEEMSRDIGLSRMHFHRKIKALTGLSPADFVRNIRLRRAAAILAQKGISVKETMAMVGFENADHFRKCFKAEFGVLPSDYPKNNVAD